MSFAESFKEMIDTINEENFESYALEVFQYQYKSCSIYQKYCNSLSKNPTNVDQIKEIPFLPIEFFKKYPIKSGHWKEVKSFKSSGTTKTGRSTHFIKDLNFYHRLSKTLFESRYGPLSELQIIALLPSYQESGDSSLIDMIDYFMKHAKPGSGYALDDLDTLNHKLSENENKKLLFGVSYALLNHAETHPNPLKNVLIIETGGMKGRKKEITRTELHETLKKSYHVAEISSEYGMTELLSQAYGENGAFSFPNWAKTLIRDINDPFCYLPDGKTGGINVIDLANIDSCSFIETKDLGKSNQKYFEILGRFDNSDVRGCNLLF